MARLKFFLAAAWWGSLITIGFVVVPLLFKYLETPAMAGQMAGRLFTAQSWLSVVCCVMLLLATRRENRDAAETPSIWLISGLLLALLLEVGVKPHIMARENLMLWHNLGSLFYVAQCVCAATYFWQLLPISNQKTDADTTVEDA
jgi:Domain of unknown function (DUF4149)